MSNQNLGGKKKKRANEPKPHLFEIVIPKDVKDHWWFVDASLKTIQEQNRIVRMVLEFPKERFDTWNEHPLDRILIFQVYVQPLNEKTSYEDPQ